MNIEIEGKTFGMIILGLVTTMVILITLARYLLSRKIKKDLTKSPKETSPLYERNKYLSVDIFKFSGTFFNIGLTIALGLTVIAFEWTKFDKPVGFAYSSDNIDPDNFEIIRTPPQKPKKLLPPPLRVKMVSRDGVL